jgi:tetratricopeptide (TPR) repeat protein
MSRARAFAIFGGLALSLSLSVFAKSHLDEAAADAQHAPPLLVPSAPLVLTLTLGQESFAADIFWLRALEYFGDRRNKGEHFAGVTPLFDLITDLDPHFCAPYERAGLMLTTNDVERVGDANRLLRKGMTYCPDDGYIPFVLGFNLYFFQRKFDEAGDVLMKAAALPNTPEFVAGLAARVKAQAGDLESAEVFVEQFLDHEDDPRLKSELSERLAQIKTERVLRVIDAALLRANGQSVSSIADLQARGLLPRGIVDPSGGALSIEEGRAKSSRFKERLELKQDALYREVWK